MTVRIGLVAASRIAEQAIVAPLREPGVDGVELVAVGARDHERATAAARAWGVPIAFGSYAELIASDAVDALYIATPAAWHRPLALDAIAAGKHVLIEKPIANNADDARLVAEAASAHPGVVVMEAFHWRYHPSADRIAELIGSGAIGEVVHAEALFDIPVGNIVAPDIRWDVALGGGSTMDLGCYSIQWVRHAIASCPTQRNSASVIPDITSVAVTESAPGIDGSLTAELRWPSGATATIASSMVSAARQVEVGLTVTATTGTLVVTNPLAPQRGGAELIVTTAAGVAVEPVAPSSTYWHQLVAFREAIVHGTPFPTTAADGVRNMQVIDACYEAAGLGRRPTLVAAG